MSLLPGILALAMLAQSPDEAAFRAVPFSELMHGIDAGMVIRPRQNPIALKWESNITGIRQSPYDSFNFIVALVALDKGLATLHTRFKWDGARQQIKGWEKSQTLGSALRHSVTWVFEDLAEQIGSKSMSQYLSKLQYGNGGEALLRQRYWIGSTLLVSADDLSIFMDRLYRNTLPLKPSTLTAAKSLLLMERGKDWELSGIRGTGWKDGKRAYGWFAGHLKTNGNGYSFATHTVQEGLLGLPEGEEEMEREQQGREEEKGEHEAKWKHAGGRVAQEFSEEVFRHMGLLPKD